jgi:hypothetical protein
MRGDERIQDEIFSYVSLEQHVQGLPMPWMRTAAARADQPGVCLGDLESLSYCSDFDCPESRLDSMKVALLGQLRGQAGWRPPRDRDRMVA